MGPAFIPNQSLIKAAIAIEDLESSVVDTIFKAEKEVEVSKADIGVNGDDREAMAGEGDADVGSGGGFADAAFSGGDDDDSRGGAGELGFAIVLKDRFNGGEEAGFVRWGFKEGFEGGKWVVRRERGGGRRRFQG